MIWDWFFTLYSLAALILVFSILWKVVEKVFILLVALIFNEKSGLFLAQIFSIIPYYIIASFGVLLVLANGEGQINVGLAFSVGLFILINDLLGLIQGKQEALKQFDFDSIKMLNWRYFFIAVELIYFTVALFNPMITVNKFNEWIYNTIAWIQQIPIISWIIAIGATIYLIYIIIMFMIAVIGPLTAIFKKNTFNQ